MQNIRHIVILTCPSSGHAKKSGHDGRPGYLCTSPRLWVMLGAAIITAGTPLLFTRNVALEDHAMIVDRERVSLDLYCGSEIREYNMPDDWCLDTTGAPRYVGRYDDAPQTTIQHYTNAGYEKCLSGKTIVFIGDSRVRYQYLHLAAFLRLGKWMRCIDYRTLNNDGLPPDPECFLINHNLVGYGNWNLWFKESTKYLQSNMSYHVHGSQNSLCDCFHPSGTPVRLDRSENRFIERVTPFGDVNLVFLQSFINQVRMSAEFPPYASFPPMLKRCKPGECSPENRTIEFEGDVNKTLWHLPQLNTTHAFVTLGWAFWFDFDAISDLSCTIQEFERHHPEIDVYLLSHPPNVRDLANPTRVFDRSKLKCIIKVIDRTRMTANVPTSWYFDPDHVWGILNEEYNHLLIESICPFSR
jgi:hypothetical protein